MIDQTYVVRCGKCGIYLHDSDSPPGYETCDSCKSKNEEETEAQRVTNEEAEQRLREIWHERAESGKGPRP